MDAAKAVPQKKVDAIIEAIHMAATSSGTHSFELIVVTDIEVRTQIFKAAGGQMQINDGSHLLVFAAWDNHTAKRIDEVVGLNIKPRGDLPMLQAYCDTLKVNYVPGNAAVNYAHAPRQAYITLGIVLVFATEQEVDSTPMEGIDPDAVDAILGLKQREQRSVVLMLLNCRDESGDWLLALSKMRKSRETIVTQID
jgi:nitroreductase